MRQSAIVVSAILLAFAIAAAQEEDLRKVQITVTKVSGNVYMLQGAGGNIGASVGEDGIVVVDDQYAPLAENSGRAQRRHRQTAALHHQYPLSHRPHRRECVLSKAGARDRSR